MPYQRKRKSSRRPVRRAPIKKRSYKRKAAPKRSMRATAKKMALSLMMTKKHTNTIITQPYGKALQYASADAQGNQYVHDDGQTVIPSATGLYSADTNYWTVYNPLYLPRAQGMDQAHSTTDREGNRVWANNCIMDYELEVSKRTVHCFRTRIMCGWYKSDSGVGGQELSHVVMNEKFPTYNARLDPATAQDDKFIIKYDKTRLHTPRQIYDENFSDDNTDLHHAIGEQVLSSFIGTTLAGEVTGSAPEVPNGLWTPIVGKYNFPFKRQYTYADSSGDSLQGYKPFICFGVFPCGDNINFRTVLPQDLPFNLQNVGTLEAPVTLGVLETTQQLDSMGNPMTDSNGSPIMITQPAKRIVDGRETTVTQQVSANSFTNPSPRLVLSFTTYLKDVD